MTLRKRLHCIAGLLGTLMISSAAVAQEFQQLVDAYQTTSICFEVTELAKDNDDVAAELGLSTDAFSTRHTKWMLLGLGIAAQIQPQVGDGWAGMSTELHDGIEQGLRESWSTDRKVLHQMHAMCEQKYATLP